LDCVTFVTPGKAFCQFGSCCDSTQGYRGFQG
jgi:hypothetical protein